MKKLIKALAFAAGAALLFGFASCGGNEEDTTEEVKKSNLELAYEALTLEEEVWVTSISLPSVAAGYSGITITWVSSDSTIVEVVEDGNRALVEAKSGTEFDTVTLTATLKDSEGKTLEKAFALKVYQTEVPFDNARAISAAISAFRASLTVPRYAWDTVPFDGTVTVRGKTVNVSVTADDEDAVVVDAENEAIYIYRDIVDKTVNVTGTFTLEGESKTETVSLALPAVNKFEFDYSYSGEVWVDEYTSGEGTSHTFCSIEFNPSDRTFEYIYEDECEITGTENKVHNKNSLKGTYVLDAVNKTITVTVTKFLSSDLDSEGKWYTEQELIDSEAAKITAIIDAAKACEEELTIDSFYDFEFAFTSMSGETRSREEFEADICDEFEVTSIADFELPENAEKKEALMSSLASDFKSKKFMFAVFVLGVQISVPEQGGTGGEVGTEPPEQSDITIDWDEASTKARAMIAEQMESGLDEVFMKNTLCEYFIDYQDFDATEFSVRAGFNIQGKYDSSKPWYKQIGEYFYDENYVNTWIGRNREEIEFKNEWYEDLEWNDEFTQATGTKNDGSETEKTFTLTDNKDGTLSITCDGDTVVMSFSGEYLIGMGMR